MLLDLRGASSGETPLRPGAGGGQRCRIVPQICRSFPPIPPRCSPQRASVTGAALAAAGTLCPGWRWDLGLGHHGETQPFPCARRAPGKPRLARTVQAEPRSPAWSWGLLEQEKRGTRPAAQGRPSLRPPPPAPEPSALPSRAGGPAGNKGRPARGAQRGGEPSPGCLDRSTRGSPL